jgi:hypothetical protein
MAWPCQRRNTGVAVTRGRTVVRQPDVQALDVRGDGSLRYGTRIDLTHNGQTVQLMSVPLERGCSEHASTSSAGETLLAQGPVLEGWIDAAAAGPTPFIDDGQPANGDLTALGQDMPVSCRDNPFTEFIDYLVVDRRVLPWVDRRSFRQVTDRQQDKAVWDQISDHCPVLVELWIR